MAVRINASGEYASRTASLPASTAFTICGWFYATVRTSFYSYQWILENGSGSFIAFGFTGSNELFVDGNTDATIVDATGTNWQEKWVFGALTTNGTRADLYVWAIADTSPTTDWCASTTFTPTALRVGSTLANEYANCLFSYVKAWDAVLTAAELALERWSAKPVRRTNLHLWSPFFSDLKDYSGAAKDWTMGGTLTYEDGPPVSLGACPPSRVSDTRLYVPASLTQIGTGTYSRPVVQFKNGCYEWAWTFPWPQGAGSTARATVYFVGETTSGCVSFEAQVEAVTAGDTTDLDAADSYATANPSGAISMPPTAGMLARADVTLTNIDSVAEGDYVRLRLRRVPVEGNAQAAVDVLGVVVERI